MLKAILRKAIGPENTGRLRHVRNPGMGRAWGGPFNGQRERCLFMSALIGRLRPVAIVETGTYLGTTTEWLAAFQYPVFTIENDRESQGFASRRLAAWPNVRLLKGDSRDRLRVLIAEKPEWRDAPILFYLDAHWLDDLPLVE